MRRQFLLLPLLACWLPVQSVWSQASSEPKAIGTEELKKLVDSKAKFFFLDVREPRELEEMGTLEGYVNIPLSQLEKRVSEIPRDKPVVTGCSKGVRASRAANILHKHGYKEIRFCGLSEWRDKGYELTYPKSADKK